MYNESVEQLSALKRRLRAEASKIRAEIESDISTVRPEGFINETTLSLAAAAIEEKIEQIRKLEVELAHR